MCQERYHMAMTITKPPRPSGSKELWLNAAYDSLIAGNIDGVKVMSLAKQLNLTRTGFYWHFKDISELHRALIERWEQQNTGHLIERCEMQAGNICEALFNLMECWFDSTLFDSQFDLAIRNWARIDSNLNTILHKADKARIQAVTDLFMRFGYSKKQADVRSMTVIYTQVGYISMQVKEDWDERLLRVSAYVELFSGIKPSNLDVENFMLRHQEPQGKKP
jgi:AcrR family transcriptional regulator